MVDGYDSASWLLHLPPQANWSLYGLGRYFLIHTPACQRGKLSLNQYGAWLSDPSEWQQHTSAPDVLMKHCAAFADSPLSIVIDIRAAVQCISLATKRALSRPALARILPSAVEEQLEHVCAGCGVERHEELVYMPSFGPTVRYCSQECAYAVRSYILLARACTARRSARAPYVQHTVATIGLTALMLPIWCSFWALLCSSCVAALMCSQHAGTLPEPLHIYMCWPIGWVDYVVFQQHVGPPPIPELPKKGTRGSARRKAQASKSRTDEATASQPSPQDQITVEAFTSYMKQVGTACWARQCTRAQWAMWAAVTQR